MRSIHSGKVLATAVAALLVAACGSSGMGDILGSPSDRPSAMTDEVRGTVRYVDTSGDCVIELEDTRFTQRSSLRDDDGLGTYREGDRVTVYCDDQTVVNYQGRTYRPQALERGDEIAVRIEQSGNRFLAERIDVLYDVTQGDDDRADDRYGDDRRGYGGDLRGTVRRVDQESRTILIDRVEVYDRTLEDFADDRLTLYYDTDTDVEFEGERYRAENLEPGDEIEVEVYEVRGRLIAEAIEVVSDVRASRY